MADYVVCNKNNIDAGLLFTRLWSSVNATTYNCFRVKDYGRSGAISAKVIDCQNEAQFNDLFKQALELEGDGQPVLRIFMEDHTNGAGLSAIPSCDIQAGVTVFGRNAFVELVGTGEVCLYVANVL